MNEGSIEGLEAATERSALAVRSPVASHVLALAVASLSLFWATGTAYYHFFRLGTAVEESLYTNSIIAAHDLFGVSAILLLAAFPFLWSMIYFFEEERIGGLGYKAFGTVAAAAFLSILCGLLGGDPWGGGFGNLVGAKMAGVFGEKIAFVLLLASFGVSLFLATERFFSLRGVPRGAERGGDSRLQGPATDSSPSWNQSSLDIDDVQAIENKGFEIDPLEESLPAVDSISAEVEFSEKRGEEGPLAPRGKRERKPKAEKFDLEAVLEIAPEEKLPPAPAAEAELDAAPAPSERRERLEQAAERATKNYVLPAVAPSTASDADSSSFLDSAARLVIEEGRASVSLLQRRLYIPFSRASLLLDLLEKEGVIGPYHGGPSRAILLGLAEWEHKQKTRSQDSPTLPQA